MKLFLYYAFCSVKNQIRKLFKSWVAIFLAVCLLFGVLLGIGIGVVDSFLGEDAPEEEIETVVPEEEPEPLDPETAVAVTEVISFGVVLAVLFFSVITADKNGSSIFLMADVNLLFSAPMKPQSVLLFRLMSQIFLTLFASIYLLFQLPNLIVNLGMDAMTVIAIMAVWVMTLVYGKLLNILIYTVASTHIALKKWIRPILYATLILIAGCFYLYHIARGEQSPFASALAFFNAPVTRWIPVVGWLKGLLVWTMEGAWLQVAITSALLLGGIVVTAILVWNMKADFYEDAMAKSEETAAMLAATQSGQTKKRKKDRADRIVRDGLNFGSGAMMFFCKTLYNRFRFATWRIFTKTTVFYLVLSVGISLISKFFANVNLFFVVGLVLCGAVFFRSLGNPIANDVNQNCFVTVPASPYAKVIWSLLGGTVDCALDLLPSIVISAVILGASPVEALAYLLLALAMDFYASNTMLFLELSLPTSLALQIKQAISILFIYFGIIPIAAVVIVGLILDLYLPFLFVAAGAATMIGGAFYAVSPLFLLYGRK